MWEAEERSISAARNFNKIPSFWLGCFGSQEEADRQTLARLAGPGNGLAVGGTGGEPATRTVRSNAVVSASIGTDESGCSATLDSSAQTLTLTCDPFGLFSTYWTQIGHTVWCSSDLRVLQQLPGVSTTLDPRALHGYLCFSYVPTPLTPVSQIFQIPAGSRMTVTKQGIQTEKPTRWREQLGQHGTEEETVQTLRALLREAVLRRVSSHTDTIGVALSGGLDSSLIAALLTEIGRRVHCYTLDFGPPFNQELESARRVAAYLNQPLTVVSASSRELRKALIPTAAALHQPFGDGVTVPLFLIGQRAAQDVRILFNGEGGDQLFGGWANKPMVAAEMYGDGSYDREAAYLGTFHRFYGQTDRLYTPRARARLGTVDAGAWIRHELGATGSPSLLHRLRAANLALKGAQNIAPRAVQLASAHGLSLRTPFFDQALTDWTFTLPPETFLRGACEKFLLKRVAETYLPAEIVWQEKRGMGVPTTEWCLGPLRGELTRRLGPWPLLRDGWLSPSAVADLRAGRDLPGEFRRRRVGEKLWSLFMLSLWRATRSSALRWP